MRKFAIFAVACLLSLSACSKSNTDEAPKTEEPVAEEFVVEEEVPAEEPASY